MISHNTDYRKRKKRETFFGMPVLPLIIFLALIVIVLVMSFNFQQPLTGRVIGALSVEEDEYEPRDKITGYLNLQLDENDLIPSTSNLSVSVNAIKCSHFYVCDDGTTIPWQEYDPYEEECDDVFYWLDGPWEECDDDYDAYTEYNCGIEDVGECCENGLSGFYANLNCNVGECWEKCSSPSTISLVGAISKSTTPDKGNYRTGNFSNVHGPEPQGSGAGFSGCTDQGLTGAAVQEGNGEGEQVAPIPFQPIGINKDGVSDPSQPTSKPDLYIVDVFESGSKVIALVNYVPPTTPSQGPVSVSFTVVACWASGGGMITGAAGTNPNGEGQVEPVPPRAFCFFSKKYTIPKDSPSSLQVDLGSINVRGKTVQVIVDYYDTVDESNENNNVMYKSFDITRQVCIDTDGGSDKYVLGTCSSGIAIPRYDRCLNLTHMGELNCQDGSCEEEIIYCEENCLAFDVDVGMCIKECVDTDGGKNPSIPGQTYWTNPQLIDAKLYDACSIGYDYLYEWYCNEDNLIDYERIECPGQCVLDENDIGYCNVTSKQYNCDGWDNVYRIPLEELDVRAPRLNYMGWYTLDYKLSYGDVVMASGTSDVFEVYEPTHYACKRHKCVLVGGDDGDDDQCEIDEDCENLCNEDWQYSAWSTCIDGEHTRECFDAEECGTTYAMPTECVYSSFEGGYYETDTCVPQCYSDWVCDGWSRCTYPGELQEQTCEDLNQCDPQNYQYVQERDCCIEQWDCSWGLCIGGIQRKVCEDTSYCGTEFNKPYDEERGCTIPFAWWVWVLVIVVLGGAVFAVLYFTKGVRFRGKRKKLARPPVKKRVYPELDNYINSALRIGMKKEQIKKKLIKTGWPKIVVENALKNH